MTYVAESTTRINELGAVASVVSEFKRLTVDDQLAALWYVYLDLGRAITPAAPGAARLHLAEGLLNQIKTASHDQQLEMMRDLAAGRNTPFTRGYGVLSANTKLAFWYQLAEWMGGPVVPMPAGYRPAGVVSVLLSRLRELTFNQQITALRQMVVDMGVDPLA
ncbi:MAG: Orange carotenoid protein [Gloeomargaritaceae cyanobacterium C42_A2020_066]|nr:Orange carotenoid protein [Gloeomargaritaceae cyanobacterium C42_A2020_066]